MDESPALLLEEDSPISQPKIDAPISKHGNIYESPVEGDVSCEVTLLDVQSTQLNFPPVSPFSNTSPTSADAGSDSTPTEPIKDRIKPMLLQSVTLPIDSSLDNSPWKNRKRSAIPQSLPTKLRTRTLAAGDDKRPATQPRCTGPVRRIASVRSQTKMVTSPKPNNQVITVESCPTTPYRTTRPVRRRISTRKFFHTPPSIHTPTVLRSAEGDSVELECLEQDLSERSTISTATAGNQPTTNPVTPGEQTSVTTPKFRRKSRIVVCVRKRPRNGREISQGDVDILSVPATDHIVLCEPRQRFDLTEYLEHNIFRFDRCFDENANTAEVYRHTAGPMVSSVFEGYMATCFAYGQTGSGKTFTMGGPNSKSNKLPLVDYGIYGMVVEDVFSLYEKMNFTVDCTISVNYFEIYCNKVHDLLNQKRPLRVMEDARGTVQLMGLREYWVSDVNTTLALLNHGMQLRTNGQTLANEHSSRSHSIFQINIRHRLPEDRLRREQETLDNGGCAPVEESGHYYHHHQPHSNSTNSSPRSSYPNPHFSGPLVGRFTLVDLAGNERSVDSAVTLDRMRHLESGEINKSLLALKECIRAMGNNATSYLPFRSSKLTQVLRESFVGKRSCTCMIATVSPGLSCCEHSMNTLRYAQRVKHLPPSSDLSRVTYGTALAAAEWFERRQKARQQTATPRSIHNNRAVKEPPIVRGDVKTDYRRIQTTNRRIVIPKKNPATYRKQMESFGIQPSSRRSSTHSDRSGIRSCHSSVKSRSSHPDSSTTTMHLNSVGPTMGSFLQPSSHPNTTQSNGASTYGSQLSLDQTVTDVTEASQPVIHTANRVRSVQTKESWCGATTPRVSQLITPKSPHSGHAAGCRKRRCLRVQKQRQDVIRKHEDFIRTLPTWIAEHQRLLDKAHKGNANMACEFQVWHDVYLFVVTQSTWSKKFITSDIILGSTVEMNNYTTCYSVCMRHYPTSVQIWNFSVHCPTDPS